MFSSKLHRSKAHALGTYYKTEQGTDVRPNVRKAAALKWVFASRLFQQLHILLQLNLRFQAKKNMSVILYDVYYNNITGCISIVDSFVYFVF